MSEITIQNLSDLIEVHKKEKVQQLLATFKSRNEDVGSFLTDKAKAVSFDKKNISRTYLLLETDESSTKLRGYMALNFKTIHIDQSTEVTTGEKNRLGVSPRVNSFIALLVAQYGKNENEEHTCDPKKLLGYAIELSIELQKKVGGLTTVLLECDKDNEKLNTYYEELGFQQLQISDDLSQYYIFINRADDFVKAYS